MKLICDPPKRATNLKEHKFDMEDLTIEFFEMARFFETRDGRFKAIGFFDGRPVSVIVKPLGNEALSIISMRIASKKERRSIR